MNSMMGTNIARQKAYANVIRAIDTSLRFPENIFRGIWGSYSFFDADWVFNAQFAERMRELFKIEDGKCVCMIDLDAEPEARRASFLIDNEISGAVYQAFLKGPSVGDGWLYGASRFGCSSDVGEWILYCEKGSEIAVIAVRDSRKAEKFSAVIARFKALPIDQAIAKPLSYGLSERGLSVEWRRHLLEQYGASREPSREKGRKGSGLNNCD